MRPTVCHSRGSAAVRGQVEWFVSHWWGTPVSVYCDALMRHAKEVKRHQAAVPEPGGTRGARFAFHRCGGVEVRGVWSWEELLENIF